MVQRQRKHYHKEHYTATHGDSQRGGLHVPLEFVFHFTAIVRVLETLIVLVVAGRLIVATVFGVEGPDAHLSERLADGVAVQLAGELDDVAARVAARARLAGASLAVPPGAPALARAVARRALQRQGSDHQAQLCYLSSHYLNTHNNTFIAFYFYKFDRDLSLTTSVWVCTSLKFLPPTV